MCLKSAQACLGECVTTEYDSLFDDNDLAFLSD